MQYKQRIYSTQIKSQELIGEGRLQIGAFAVDEGMPASNATIQVMNHDDSNTILEELITDSSGQTAEINLACPPIEFSLEPDRPKPFTEYDLRITLEGYEPVIIDGAQIFANTTAIQNINLRPIQDAVGEEQFLYIDAPTLWGDFPPKIPEEDVKELPPSTGFVVLPAPVIPEYVIVHDGVPTNASAPNYWIPFKDYIKNVASCEIYSTWPDATIRANILAIISFTLNRIYTEWYRGKGYDFTITSSTAYDHAFTYGRNIYKEISTIVDEMFTTFITRPGIRQPLLTQYCDGRRVSCPTWMTQWGSMDLGEQGYSAMEILRSFYGPDIFLMQAERVSGVPLSFPGTALQAGSTGQNVRVIQEQLNAISNNFPAIRKVRVDGIYGPDTIEAVETFQRVFNLPITGIVDFGTWYKISDVYVAVTRMAELN